MSEESKMEVTLPPYPDGFFAWSENDQQLKYGGDMNDIHKRMGHKLYSAWLLWADIRTNEKLMQLLNTVTEDTQTDEYYLKNIIVNMTDRLGKLLCNTDITQELLFKPE